MTLSFPLAMVTRQPFVHTDAAMSWTKKGRERAFVPLLGTSISLAVRQRPCSRRNPAVSLNANQTFRMKPERYSQKWNELTQTAQKGRALLAREVQCTVISKRGEMRLGIVRLAILRRRQII